MFLVVFFREVFFAGFFLRRHRGSGWSEGPAVAAGALSGARMGRVDRCSTSENQRNRRVMSQIAKTPAPRNKPQVQPKRRGSATEVKLWRAEADPAKWVSLTAYLPGPGSPRCGAGTKACLN